MEEENTVPGALDLSTALPSGNELGRETDRAKYERERKEQAESQSWYQTLGIATDERTTTWVQGVKDSFTSGGNFAYNLANRIEMEYQHKTDPNFDSETFLKEDMKVIPSEYWPQLKKADSAGLYAATKDSIIQNMDARKRLERLGVTGGLTSGFVAGMFDIDMPLTVATGFVGKAGLMSTRLGRGLAGGAIMGTSAAIGESASVTPEWGNVALSALMGMGLASIGPGGVRDTQAESLNQSVRDMTDGVDAKLQEPPQDATNISPNAGGNLPRRPQVINAETVVSDKGSAGARQLTSTDMGLTAENPRIGEISNNSKAYLKRTGIHMDYFYDYAPALAKKGGKAAAESFRKFSDMLQTTGIATDFDKMFKTGSATAQWLAHITGSNAAGIIQNRKSAAHVSQLYEKQLLDAWRPDMEDAWTAYAKSKGQSKLLTWTGGGEVRTQFNKEVYAELEARRLDGPADKAQRQVDENVAKAADAHDRWSAMDVKLGKGDGNNGTVLGYKEIDPYSGYAERRMTPQSMMSYLRTHKLTEADLRQAWQEFYEHGGLDQNTAAKVAQNIMSRAKAGERGADTNLWALLQGDSRDHMISSLKNEGLPPKVIDDILKRLTGDIEQRGKAGSSKHRLEGDIRFEASNGIKIIDLIDTNIDRNLTRRSRTMAGRASLARWGIESKADIDDIIDTILFEQQNARAADPTPFKEDKVGAINDWIDKDRPVNREWLENYFAQLQGGISQGHGFQRIQKLVGLSTLSQMGIGAQAAEFGAVAAGIGIKEFFKQLPASVTRDIADVTSPLSKELRDLGLWQREERLHSPTFHNDYNNTMYAQSDLAQHADNLLGAGQRLQGVVSGFHKIRGMQQAMAVIGATNNLFRFIRDGDGHTGVDRLATWGVDAKMIEGLKSELKHVEWEGDSIVKLNLDKWDNQLLVEDYALAINNAMDIFVQRGHHGEGFQFMHRDGVMSLFWQLKSFPMQAIQKQFGRSIYQGDSESAMLALFGYTTAALAMTAKAVANNQVHTLTPEKLGKLAFGMSNTFGWIPMFTDPALQMFGINNGLGAYAGRGDVISSPVALGVLNKMAGIPSAIPNLVTGSLSGSDVQALQSIPVFGRMYGMNYILQALRDK